MNTLTQDALYTITNIKFPWIVISLILDANGEGDVQGLEKQKNTQKSLQQWQMTQDPVTKTCVLRQLDGWLAVPAVHQYARLRYATRTGIGRKCSTNPLTDTADICNWNIYSIPHLEDVFQIFAPNLAPGLTLEIDETTLTIQLNQSYPWACLRQLWRFTKV